MKIKKTLAAIAAAAMVFTSIPMTAFAADHSHTVACYETTSTTHKLSATKCAAAVAAADDGSTAAAADGPTTEHSGWTHVMENSAKVAGKKKCGVCGYITTCEHKTYVKGSATGKKKCNICDYEVDCTTHTWVAGDAATGKKCSLCDTTAECNHTTKKYVQDTDPDNHKEVCTECGKVTTAAAAHAADTTGTHKNDTHHWKVCGTCKLEYDKASHTFAVDTNADNSGKDGHTEKCACGATKVVKHTLTYSSGAKDADGHVAACTCGYTEKVAHTLDASATVGGKDVKKCSVCNYESDEVCEHVYDGWKDNSGHKQACSVCGKVKDGGNSHAATADTKWTTSAEKHWHVCKGGDGDCTIKIDEVTHTFATQADVEANGTYKLGACKVCGYIAETKPETPDDNKDDDEKDPGTTNPGTTTPGTTPGSSDPGASTPAAPAASGDSSSSSSSGSAPSGTAGTVPTVASASEMRTSNNTNVNIKAAETKVTPAMVKAFVNNKKTKTMTITYSTALKVSVSKSDIKDASADFDFSVSGNNFLSSKIKNSSALSKAKKIVQIDFVNKGKLDGIDKVTVQSRVGGKYAGQKATVYEYVNGKLVKIATAKVGGSGLVSFKVDHLGQYVVVVD